VTSPYRLHGWEAWLAGSGWLSQWKSQSCTGNVGRGRAVQRRRLQKSHAFGHTGASHRRIGKHITEWGPPDLRRTSAGSCGRCHVKRVKCGAALLQVEESLGDSPSCQHNTWASGGKE
jgi:hypothetical protein